MGSAHIQLSGNVATKLKMSMDNPGHERVSFRVIANDRRFDATTNTWLDGDEFSVTVVCWGSLARGVAPSVMIGDPVVVTGKILNRRYEAEGETRYATEVKAVTVSHDLTRGTATFRKIYHKPAVEAAPEENYEVRETPDSSAGSEDPYRLPAEQPAESQPAESQPAESQPSESEPAEFAISSNGGAPF